MQYEYTNEIERMIKNNITKYTSNIRVKYGLRKSAKNIKLSMFTKKYISSGEFNDLLGQYRFYGFDKRYNQIVFISKLWSNQYLWMFIEIEIDTKINKEVVYGRQEKN